MTRCRPMSEPRIVEHLVELVVNVATTRDDIRAALDRSGIAPGLLIGEALIESVEVMDTDTEDEA
jgi:hypothetical protein